ncbi:MAG: hypothetical protein NWF07_01485 [Candidatus Bathyarchaeota archaeon]|nr:hypothetical protein [Candidatus Bathyarchaeota archaeon]
MRKRVIGIGLVVICLLGMMTTMVYGYAEQSGEDSDGDHDRTQGRDHPNAEIMNGVGNYAIRDPPRSGIGAS